MLICIKTYIRVHTHMLLRSPESNLCLQTRSIKNIYDSYQMCQDHNLRLNSTTKHLKISCLYSKLNSIRSNLKNIINIHVFFFKWLRTPLHEIQQIQTVLATIFGTQNLVRKCKFCGFWILNENHQLRTCKPFLETNFLKSDFYQ